MSCTLVVSTRTSNLFPKGHKDFDTNNLRYQPGQVITVLRYKDRANKNPRRSAEFCTHIDCINMTMAHGMLLKQPVGLDKTHPDWTRRALRLDFTLFDKAIREDLLDNREVSSEISLDIIRSVQVASLTGREIKA